MDIPILRAYACYQCAKVVWLDLVSRRSQARAATPSALCSPSPLLASPLHTGEVELQPYHGTEERGSHANHYYTAAHVSGLLWAEDVGRLFATRAFTFYRLQLRGVEQIDTRPTISKASVRHELDLTRTTA